MKHQSAQGYILSICSAACLVACCAHPARAAESSFLVSIENTSARYFQEGGVTDLNGNAASFDPSYAPRVELSYFLAPDLAVRAAYWGYDDEADSDTGTIAADAHNVDIEAVMVSGAPEAVRVSSIFGIRWAEMCQTVSSGATLYTFDFRGFGGACGVLARRHVGIGSVCGRAKASLLVGDGVIEAGANRFVAYDLVATQLEIGFGFEFDLPASMKVSVGAEWQRWSNLALADTSFGGVGNDDVMEDAGFAAAVVGFSVAF